MINVADYLRGFVAGYWQGFDFGINPPREACDEGGDEGGSATGGADASSPAPAPGPATSRFATAAPAGAPADAGPVACADSLLPAIRQPALPEGVAGAGALEGLYVHRGMVLGLNAAAERFFALDLPEAEQECRAMIAQAKQDLRGTAS